MGGVMVRRCRRWERVARRGGEERRRGEEGGEESRRRVKRRVSKVGVARLLFFVFFFLEDNMEVLLNEWLSQFATAEQNKASD